MSDQEKPKRQFKHRKRPRINKENYPCLTRDQIKWFNLYHKQTKFEPMHVEEVHDGSMTFDAAVCDNIRFFEDWSSRALEYIKDEIPEGEIIGVGEEWRDTPGLPLYQVSNLGRVRRSDYRKILKGWSSFGYRVVNVCINGESRKYLVHVLVALAFIGERPTEPNGQQYDVNHKDGNRDNNALSNLEYVTKSENIQHSYKYLRS